MLQIDRMEVDDAGGNPAKLALAVLNQIADLKPPVPVREIAEAVDIYEIREEQLVGLSGALVTDDAKSNGEILVNEDMSEFRKRYTIGQELGHYLSPWHRANSPEGFRCNPRDMAIEYSKPNNRAAQMEVEANKFAAELLLPMVLVNSFLDRLSGIDVDHILSLAKTFEVSREASGRRYIAAQEEPAAIIFSKDGIIRYVKTHQYFPALDVWRRDPLPDGSLSKRSGLPVGQVSEWGDVDGGIWLREPKGRRICEQTMAQRDGFRLTLIALEELDPEEDERETHWRAPTFHR